MKNEKINKSSKKKSKKSTSKTIYLNKINSYQKIIQDTILYVQKYKNMDILDAGELNICIQNLENIYEKTLNISKLLKNKKKLIDLSLNKNFLCYFIKKYLFVADGYTRVHFGKLLK